MLLTSFMAGLLGTLSPCVYPLIPITLSVMGVRKYDSHWHGFWVALAYVAGMVLLHTALGVLFASLGVLAGSRLQSPWVNIFLAILMLIMALNLMGLFTWKLPPRLSQTLTQVGAHKGHHSAFLMGLVAGLIAMPCTGPILAGILTLIAEQRDISKGSLLMFVYALGMGLPFLLLGTFSSSASKLPKSGPWMNRVKFLLGLVMLGVALHYGKLGIQGFRSSKLAESPVSAQITRAQAQNKRVILDFWADWCTLCHELDEVTFKDPKVLEALKDYELIRVDVTVDSEENKALQAAYGVVGLPTLVFVERSEKIHGFVSAEKLIQILAAVKQAN